MRTGRALENGRVFFVWNLFKNGQGAGQRRWLGGIHVDAAAAKRPKR
jgi:hypothetical protein